VTLVTPDAATNTIDLSKTAPVLSTTGLTRHGITGQNPGLDD